MPRSLTGFVTVALFLLLIPSGCDSARAGTPRQQYDRVWQLVRDNSCYQDRLGDWDKWKNPPDRLRTFADAEKAINQMLDTVKDPYTYYKNASLTAWSEQRRQRQSVVSHKMLPGSIGYIKITTFSSEHTANEVESAMRALSGAKAIVVDLRNNGGGLIWQSFETYALFCDEGYFKTMKGRSNGSTYEKTFWVNKTNLVTRQGNRTTTYSRRKNLLGHRKLVLLVNGNTASASESLTGAVMEYKLAQVVGTQTFGKGIAQRTWDLANGTSVQVTCARSYLPTGRSIHGKGLTPHHVVQPSTNKTDTQLDAAIELLQKELNGKP